MKKNYFIIGLLIALAILITFLLWPDRQHDSHRDDHARVIQKNDTLKAHGIDYRRANDSLIKINRRLDSANKSLLKGQAISERQLNAKSAEVRTLVHEIREINKDTGYFGHLLDSLEEQVKSLTYLIVQYEEYADSINNVHDSVKINYEAIIKEKDKRIAELQAAYDSLLQAYKDLFATSRGMMKDLKRQKLKTKVAAVLGAAGAVIILLK